MTVGTMMAERLRINAEILNRIRTIREDMEGLARKHGMSIEDLCRIPTADVNALFGSPKGETWSGKGRKPSWLKKAEAEGLDMMDFRVSGGRNDDEHTEEKGERG